MHPAPPSSISSEILALYLKCIVSCFPLMESLFSSLGGNHDWQCFGGEIFKKNITIALSSSQIFLDLYGIPLLSQKKCIILFSVNEKKEKERWVSPGSSHFESSKSSKAVQQDTRNPLRFSAWRTKLKKRSMGLDQSLLFSQSKIQPQRVLLILKKGWGGFRENILAKL